MFRCATMIPARMRGRRGVLLRRRSDETTFPGRSFPRFGGNILAIRVSCQTDSVPAGR